MTASPGLRPSMAALSATKRLVSKWVQDNKRSVGIRTRFGINFSLLGEGVKPGVAIGALASYKSEGKALSLT